MTWSNAESYCQSTYGTSLASVTSDEDNINIRNAAIRGGFGSASLWIGGTDSSSEANFSWSDGTRFSYTNWDTDEPNSSGDEDCIEYKHNNFWNDLTCTDLKLFVCNYPQTIPTPSPTNAPTSLPTRGISIHNIMYNIY